jgi:hypothetical protein
MKLLKRVGLLKPFNPFFKPGYYLNQSNQYQEMRCDLNTMTQWLNTNKYNSAFHFSHLIKEFDRELVVRTLTGHKLWVLKVSKVGLIYMCKVSFI